MKLYQSITLVINGIAALYFAYIAAMHLFVYFANKSMGHYESFLEPGRNLVLALIFSVCSLGAWYCFNHQFTRLANVLLFFPLTVVALFALWTIILIVGSGGRWN